MSCQCLASGLVLVLLSAAAGAADWRQYRGPNGDGSSGDAAIRTDWQAKPPTLLWSLPLHDNGWSNPCVANGVVYVVDRQPPAPGAAPGKAEEIIRALDLRTGQERWQAITPGVGKDRYGYTGPTPATDGDKLFVVNRDLVVSCLDAKNGQVLWLRDAGQEFAARPPEPHWGFNVSPLLDGDRLCLVPGGAEAAVVALNKNTGATLWKAPGGPAGHASPILYGTGQDRQYVVFNGEGLVGFRAEDGQRLWTQPHPTKFNQNSATPIVVGGRIFITSAFNAGSAMVELAAGRPVPAWTSQELQARFSSPVCLNGCLFGVTDPERPGTLVCLDAATGQLRWKQPGFEFGPLAVAGGFVLAVNGKTGEVVLVEPTPAGYHELGRIQPQPKAAAWNNPVVADGKLLIRTLKTLYCYDIAPN